MQIIPLAIILAYVADTVAPVSATVSTNDIAAISSRFHHNVYVATKVRRKTGIYLNHEIYYNRRVVTAMPIAPSISPSATSASSTRFNPASSLSSNITEAACTTALTALNGQASNPSGMAICYNVASYDNSTGAFQANIELYKISQAVGEWDTVQPQGVQLGLSYPGATIATSNNTSISKRGRNIITHTSIQPVEKRPELIARTTSPQKVSEMSFVGRVDNSVVGKIYNQTLLKAALAPVIVLSGITQNGTPINTTLSSTDAAFVCGVFADQQAVVAHVEAPAQPFVLPGVHLGIFPTGLVITSSWTLLFVATVGLGTLGRRKHKLAFRRRVRNRMGLNAMNAPFNR